MTVLDTGIRRKLFQVAKELNLAHTTLMEFLNSQGFDTPKKHMSVVSSEMYIEIIKKFDRHRWQKHLESSTLTKEVVKKLQAEHLREQVLESILKDVVGIPEEMVIKQPKAEREIPAKERAKEKVEPTIAKTDAEAYKIIVKPLPEIERKALKKEKVQPLEEAGPVMDMAAEALVGLPFAEAPPIPEIVEIQAADIKEAVEALAEEADLPQEMLSVDKVVAQVMQIASHKPKITAPKEEIDKKETPAAAEKKKRRRRRRKPRRPETTHAAAGVSDQKRVKITKKKVEADKPAEPKRRRRKVRKKKIDLKEVDASIKETLAKIDERGKVKRKKRRVALGEAEVLEESNILKVTEFISAQELADFIDEEVTEVIRKSLEMGLMITINQRLDRDTIELLADEFGYSIEFLSSLDEEIKVEEEAETEKTPRAPVVTIMGHVDHGKTSLLDHIRRSNIIAGESGGITQHIGAYKVNYDGKSITFLDTPGHEAFTAMRARGAQVTDIVVLVVAADDQVMPQTVEAINHAQAAGVPMVIAINKIDKSNAQPELVKRQLADRGILVEEWGGRYQSTEISAKFGDGVDKLMDEILILSDLQELKAQVNTRARGVVIDSKLDKGRGAQATILVQKGTLNVGDNFVSGQFSGKVRALLDERGRSILKAGPSDPVQVLGFTGVPQAGDTFMVTETEKEAKNVSLRRQQLHREQSFRHIKMMTLDQISKNIKFGETQELPLIIKGDVHGSVEALSDSLMKLETEEVSVLILHKGVGAVTESDVLLAAASDAVIIGFHVHANKNARELALQQHVEIKSYRIIYDVINDVKMALEGLLAPDLSEEVLGEAEIRDVFKISALGSIAGCYVGDGKIERGARVKVFREGVQIFNGEIETLKRFKDDAKEVVSGYECGIKLKNFNDIKVGDIIQVYRTVETKRTLSF